MAPRRPRTLKAKAVGLAAVVGQSEAARQLGVPLQSVNRWWQDPAFGIYREAKSEDIAEAYRIGVFAGLSRMLELIPIETDLGKLNAATGTAFDKYMLVTGQATARTEHRDLDGTVATDDDRQRARLAYLTALPSRPMALGNGTGSGATSNGHEALRAVQLSEQAPDRPKPKAPSAEGSSNGHQPDGGDRGTVAS